MVYLMVDKYLQLSTILTVLNDWAYWDLIFVYVYNCQQLSIFKKDKNGGAAGSLLIHSLLSG